MSLRQFDHLDQLERGLWVEDWRQQQAQCPDCGNPRSECSDPGKNWYPFRTICYATMEREAAQATYAELHEYHKFHDGTFTSWSPKRTELFPYQFDSGVRISVTGEDLTPWDLFTRDTDANPVHPSRRDPDLEDDEHPPLDAPTGDDETFGDAAESNQPDRG